MKDFKPQADDWHYKLVREHMKYHHYSMWEQFMPEDFCSYWRIVVAAIMPRVMAFLMLSIIFGISAYYLVNIVIYEPGVVFAVIIIGLTAWLVSRVALVIKSKIKKRKENSVIEPKKEKAPGILEMKYLAWKNKYCPRVSYEESE